MKLPLNEINWYFINQLEILKPKKRSCMYIPNTKLFLSNLSSTFSDAAGTFSELRDS